MSEHDHLITMLNRLKLTALRDQLDSLVDEAGRRELTIRDALALFCEREIGGGPHFRLCIFGGHLGRHLPTPALALMGPLWAGGFMVRDTLRAMRTGLPPVRG